MVGVTSDVITPAIGTLHFVATVDGVTKDDELVAPGSDPSWQPKEIKLEPTSSDGTGAITVTIDGYAASGWTSSQGGAPIFERLAQASFVPHEAMLLRVNLDGTCIEAVPGGPTSAAPMCTAPATCILGICASDVATSLEPYAPNWPTNVPDVCKPANAGPAVVQVGTGQTDYLPRTDGQTVQMELGPQGGHHIWIATRMENLRQSGSTTTISSTQPGGTVVPPTTAYVFSFDPGEGGFCQLYGLRYQLDATGEDYHQFLGKPLDVTVTIQDSTGAMGSGTASIVIGSTLICPDGTSDCNN